MKAQELMSTGKRHYICGEVQDAIDLFSQACEMLSDKYGQTADLLASPYLYYGKALLEMARIENGVLGHAVQDGSALADENDTVVDESIKEKGEAPSIEIEEEELPDEKRAEIRKDVEHAMREGNLYNDQTTEDEITDDEGTEDEEEEIEEKGNEQEEKEKKEEKMEEDVPIDQEKKDSIVAPTPVTEEDDDEVTTMQLAWEMLELSYTIFKRIGAEACMRQAECKHLLGQVSMEKEHYSQAVGDFIESYELQKNTLESGDRRLAEACYNVGLAYSFDKKFTESVMWYKKAVEALEKRIAHLEHKLRMRAAEEYGEVVKSQLYMNIQKEIDELRDLVVLDMMAKIEDVELSHKQYNSSIHAMKSMAKDIFNSGNKFEGGFDSIDKSQPGVSVSDISHRVVRKRKSIDDAEGTSDMKKVKNAVDLIPRAEQHA